jgi:hypothetical protein
MPLCGSLFVVEILILMDGKNRILMKNAGERSEESFHAGYDHTGTWQTHFIRY